MYFKNDKSEIEIFVDGYTDFPEKYSEEVGKNALSCTVFYSLDRAWGKGVLFDELFQTDEIILLHKRITALLEETVDTVDYKDKWNCFTFIAKKNKIDYDVYINIIARGGEDINGNFKMTFSDLKEIAEELNEYIIKYPVV